MQLTPRSAKNRARTFRNFVVGFMFSLSLVFALGVFYLIPNKAQAVVPVEDVAQEHRNVTDAIYNVLQNAFAVAWKKGLSYFLNKIAYDAAVRIGSGGKGQKPLTIKNARTYLGQVADGAAGEFLDKEFQALFGESLCSISFDPAIRLKLGVFAKNTYGKYGQQASCPVTGMIENINKISKMSLQDMVDFQHVFNINSSELGAYFLILDETDKQVAKAEAAMQFEQQASSFLGVKDIVTGVTKTPKEYINQVADLSISESTAAEKAYTGRPLADAFSIFTNTLISRLYKTIFEKGVVPEDRDYPAPGSGTGVAAAKRYFAELAKPTFRETGPVDIMGTLASCPADNRTVNNCVINDNFADAINRKLTVRQALEEGSLNPSGTFGFDSTGQEPDYSNGYPYRSLVILRKYRIIPSTWESTALFIRNFVDPAQSLGLKELVDLYDDENWTNASGDTMPNPFYHLIDPNWVLKAPETYCRREGPGEELAIDSLEYKNDTSGDGVIDERDTPTQLIERKDYCADERTCIEEAADGSCKFFGYCAKEKNIWRFEGTACKANENTCQTFVDSKNKTASYIESTVNRDSCTPDNANCQWYCQNYDNKEKAFVCSSPEHVIDPAEPDYFAAGDQIRLDKDAGKCSSGDRGCTEYIPVAVGSNLAANSGFESFIGTADDLNPDTHNADYSQWKWEFSGDTFAVSDAMDGTYALRTSAEATYTLDTESPVYQKTFTVSFFAKGACDDIHVEMGGNHTGGAWTNYADLLDSHRVSPDSWSRVVVTAQFGEVGQPNPPPPDTNPNQLAFKIFPNCDIKLDGVQLELGEATIYSAYDTANQSYLKNKAANYVSNYSFAFDSGHDFYKDDTLDNFLASDHMADGWVDTNIVSDDGYGDYFSGTGGYQDVPIVYGTRYDVSAWVKGGGNTPLLTECRDKDRALVPDCNMAVNAVDPRSQRQTNTGRWDFITFGVEADKPEAAFIRLLLTGGQFDQVSVSMSKESLACRIDEIGCDLYTPDEKGDKVPAVVSPDDYCPAEFVGCKSYIQQPVNNGTLINLVERDGINAQTGGPDFSLIAKGAKTCDAAYVGCEEFTNLDIVAQGGEGLEYYSAIRRCEQPNPTCATYYRWEGDDTTGFELVAEELKGGLGQAPDMTPGGACGCNPDDFGCTEYYDQSGNSYLCPMFNTITCSEDCHPLRNSLENTIYNAIPDQSIKCPASQAACREYRGSTGYNIRKIVTDNFDDGDTAGWTGNVTYSTESLKAGGGSAKATNDMSTAVSELIEDGKDYMIEFWAKAETADSTINVDFAPNGAVFPPGLGVLATNKSWNHYVLGPAHFVGTPDPVEVITIHGSAPFFIDNITVWETRDSVYLRYKTYQDCPPEWVGCSLYTDSEGEDHNLQSFTNLCRPEKVGCTAAIETHNSTTAFPFEPADHGVKVEADNVRPVVNIPRFKCQSKAKGCEGLGLPTFDVEGRVTKFKTTYLLNDPDTYDQSLCTVPETFCDQFQIGKNTGSYTQFKQPNAQVCDYRSGVNYGGVKYDAWFKRGTDKFCPVPKYTCIGGDNAGAVCFEPFNDPICTGGGRCEEYFAMPMPAKVCGSRLQETCRGGYHDGLLCDSRMDPKDALYGCDDPAGNNDGFCTDLTEICYGGPRAGETCDSDANPNDTTFGCADENSENDGYCAEKVCHDDSECLAGQTCSEMWVGSCKESASGCSEYRDPQDPEPSEIDDTGKGCRASCALERNEFGLFYRTDDQCLPYFNDDPDLTRKPGCQPYYQIADSIETASCAGVVTQDEGCMLFNDTTSSSGLVYDSDETYAQFGTQRGSPVQCPGAPGCVPDSNSVIQVTRDRVCSQWLYCKTSFTTLNSKNQEERQCYSIGNCQKIGSTGECIKPVGQGQCAANPAQPCRRDDDCAVGDVCVPAPKYVNPLPDLTYLNRLVTPVDHPTDLTFAHRSEVDQARYFSGYSRAGFSWGCSDTGDPCWRDAICQGGNNDGGLCRTATECPGGTCPINTACDINNPTFCDQCPGPDTNICRVVHGYYPAASMNEVGFDIQLRNYDFELPSTLPWQEKNLINALSIVPDQPPYRNNHVMRIAAHPQNPAPVDNGVRTSLSNMIVNGQRYMVSLKLRADADTTVTVLMCHNNDDCVNHADVFAVSLDVKDYWQEFRLPLSGPLTAQNVGPGGGASFLNVLRYTQPPPSPNNTFYMDDVKLQPVLEKKSTNNPPELPSDLRFVDRACRLYPESDSTQCIYVDATNRFHIGWRGYCLEKDPHDASLCLQWWPVDVIRGEYASGEIGGYMGSFPLYYCAQMSLREYRRPYFLQNKVRRWAFGGSRRRMCDVNYYAFKCAQTDLNNWPDKYEYWCIPNGIPASEVCTFKKCKKNVYNDECGYGAAPHNIHIPETSGYWADFDGTLANTPATWLFGLNGTVEPLGLQCDLVAQVVDPSGVNVAWTDRIIDNSYSLWDLGINIDADLAPYGSLVTPRPGIGVNETNNPFTWDSNYTGDWGSPFVPQYPEDGNIIGDRNQPIYFLSDNLPQLAGYGWKGPVDTALREANYLTMARAGTPFSCRQNHPTIQMCDTLFQPGIPYYEFERFGGFVQLNGQQALKGGLGLKRNERLFADVVNMWVWGDGQCLDVDTFLCVKPGDPNYPLFRNPCEVVGDCNIDDGICATKVCNGGNQDGQPCGCPAGEYCEPQWRCTGNQALCSDDACVATATDRCTSGGRCVSGTKTGLNCNVANNCTAAQGECQTNGGITKCTALNPVNCGCPNMGTCQVASVCRDNGQLCGGGQNCQKYCDDNIDGWGDYWVGRVPCIDSTECNPTINCLFANPVQVCQNQSRCSGNQTVPCNPAQNCVGVFSCDANSKCTVGAGCDCPNTIGQNGAYCADGVCDNPPVPPGTATLCASNGTGPACPVPQNCNAAADICRESNKRCDCAGNGNCNYGESCSASGGPCNNNVCGPGATCIEKVCYGGPKEGEPCNNDAQCEDPDDPTNNGICADTFCLSDPANGVGGEAGLYPYSPCSSDAHCVGVQGGQCQNFPGQCVGGDEHGAACQVNADCPSGGICADKVCAGGALSGESCVAPLKVFCVGGDLSGTIYTNIALCNASQCVALGGQCFDPNNSPPALGAEQYCNLNPDPNFSAMNPKYWEDHSVFSGLWHTDFKRMHQCRFQNGSNGLNDTRPNPITRPNPRDPDPKDYCWVQPVTFNIKINNRTGSDVLITNGGGTVVVQFNSQADKEQLPVKFVIQWGDGTNNTIQTIPGFLPRSNPNGPYHVATHDYSAPDCPAPIGCIVRVFTMDNWASLDSNSVNKNGKGSGYCSNSPGPEPIDCTSDIDCGGGLNSCVGVCRGGAAPFAYCLSDADCPGNPNGYCSSVYNGRIIVQP